MVMFPAGAMHVVQATKGDVPIGGSSNYHGASPDVKGVIGAASVPPLIAASRLQLSQQPSMTEVFAQSPAKSSVKPLPSPLSK